MTAAPWGDSPYDQKTPTIVVHDYVMVRGDLSEPYARAQLAGWIERYAAHRSATRIAQLKADLAAARSALGAVEAGEPHEVTQTIFASPELNAAGVYGNCIQAAVASLLGWPLDAVPHFGAFRDWQAALRLWAEGEDLTVEWLDYPDEIPADEERCLFLGPSPRGFSHVVVGKGGEVIHDPHPSRDGLDGIDGVIRIYRLTPPQPAP